MKILLCFSLLLALATSRGCEQKLQVDQKGTDIEYSASVSESEKADIENLMESNALKQPCRPIVVHAYDDVSKSVNNGNSAITKQLIISGLRKHPEACVRIIKLTRFGAGSVWSTPPQEFVFPLHPSCAAEPDYDQLPPAVRNLEVWRQDLRQQNEAQCKAHVVQFRRDFESAVSTFEAALLRSVTSEDGTPNSCTSFSNMLQRARVDIGNSTDNRILILSDLVWSCRENSPHSFRAKGVIVQIASAELDDRIRTTFEERSSVLTRVLPNVVVIQEVNADRTIEELAQTK